MNTGLLLFLLLCVLMFLGIPIAVSLCMSTVIVMMFCLDVNMMSFLRSCLPVRTASP